MKSFEHGTGAMHNRKYEDNEYGQRRKNTSSVGVGARASARALNPYPDSLSSRNAEDLAREVNSAATTENDNYYSHPSSSHHPPSRLSKYGSSITLLHPAADQHQASAQPPKPSKKASSKDKRAYHKVQGNQDLDLKHSRYPESHLAASKVVTHTDLRKIKPGILSKPPSRPEMSLSTSSRQAEKSSRHVPAQQPVKADIPRSGGRASRRKSKPASESARVHPFSTDNQINYKLMEKVPVSAMREEELQCLQEAVRNLEACLPTQPADDSQESSSTGKTTAVPLIS